MMTEKALAIVENVNLPVLGNDLAEAIAEEMDGLTIEFDRVRIPSGGGLAFEIPGDDPDNPELAKEIVGVIVDHHPVNAYWAIKYSGENNPPDCSSMDGKEGVDQDGNRNPCNSCPHNEWGSDEDGRGKACKNMRRIYILPKGEMFPLLLTLPPTSLKNFSNYLAKRIIGKGRRSYNVLTKVSLKKAVSSGGITYSQASFSLAGVLSEEDAKKMEEYSRGIKAITRKLEVAADEYIQTESAEVEDIM
jgi:hypothetical protein